MNFPSIICRLRQNPLHLTCLVIFVCGLTFRFYGLENHFPDGNEIHYRVDMYRLKHWWKDWEFRNHSVEHGRPYAPHALLSPLISNIGRKTLSEPLYHLLPDHDFKRDNFQARFSHALLSSWCVWFMFRLASFLFSKETALIVMLMTACSPMQIMWGRSEYLDIAMSFFALLTFIKLWECLHVNKLKILWRKAAWAGLFGGLTVVSKWSALCFVVIFPLSFALLSGIQQRAGRLSWDRKHFYLPFCAAAASIILIQISIKSFRWVIASDPGDNFGDVQYEIGIIPFVLTGIKQLFVYQDWTYLILWGGILFPMIFFYSLYLWGKDVGRHTNEKNIFTGCILAAGLATMILNHAQYSNWRIYMMIHSSLLCLGYFFDRLNDRARKVWVAVIFLTMLPLSVYYGLRLSHEPLLLNLYGADFTFFDHLPPQQ